MFNLLRHFSIASAVVVLVVTTVLAVLYNRHENTELIASAEYTNTTLAHSFSSVLRTRFFEYINTIENPDGDAIRADPRTLEIDDVLRDLTFGLPILKVKIYSLDGLTVYSSDYSQIGEYKTNNIGFLQSARNGKAASKFSFRGSFSAFSGALADRSLVESYVPIIDVNGKIEGVFELYTDVTPLVERINRETVKVVAGLFIAFGFLYAILFLIVRRADNILRLQYASLTENSVELVAQNEALEREIAERERAEEALRASELQLRQTQRMDAIGQLTGGLAHDFNNLLAIVQGSIDLLGDQLGSDNRLLQTVQRATTRGAELTQRLLAYSRKQPLQARPFDLAELVDGMSEFLARSLGAPIEIEVKTDPDLMNALADPGQVENTLLNLALNARDAMPDGGKLTIECRNAVLDDDYVARNPEAIAGDYVVLAVSDAGVGMTAEVKAQAFEPFFTTKGVGEGSGLGLSMVYGFAKQSGGQVTIYSEVGKGTTVKLYLPRAAEAAPLDQVSRDKDIPRGGGERILVIEDDPDVSALVVDVLQGLNYQVIAVAEAASAHKVLASGDPVDLVLSDVVLPGGTSGPEFAEQARATNPDLKVIFMSGYPAEAAKRNGFLGSGQVLLNKPFQRPELATALRALLD